MNKEWQSIDLAPKDGTKILAGWFTEQYHFSHQVRVHDGWYWTYAVVEWMEDYHSHGDFEWCLSEIGSHATSASCFGVPTHFQFLLEPPPNPDQVRPLIQDQDYEPN